MGSPATHQPDGAKMSHVNLMTDTIIANLPEEGLRSVLRSMLATEPSITPILEARTKDYLKRTSSISDAYLFTDNANPIETLKSLQQRIRTMIGCGMCFDSIVLLAKVALQVANLESILSDSILEETLSSLDGDIIQALTAVQKTLLTSSGSRAPQADEASVLGNLHTSLMFCQQEYTDSRGGSPFDRSFTALRSLLGIHPDADTASKTTHSVTIPPLPSNVETLTLVGKSLPRLFSGLWQLSSPSWGIATTAKIQSQFQEYAAQGFTAYDMADHYGDAEVVFGKFRNSCTNPDALFGATKYCIFTPTTITEEVVRANVTERCQRMSSDHVDLLQFHWQFYGDPQYIQALKHLEADPRVHALGLCNFDTQRMQEILDAGIKIHTNQVQFSLIDSRPTYKMGAVCEKHNIKLLTYGTLCGGFIAEKWLDKPEPELFLNNITPSQRKYYEMIVNWGGWTLFQELLVVLKTIATKHNVSISNVATRWVLDFPYVGAVIVGTRMGVSGHAEENLKCYGWRLDTEDQTKIEDVLRRSKRDRLIELLGDCGGEYR